MSDSSQPHGLQPIRLLHPWNFPGKSTGVGCHCLLWKLLSRVQLLVTPWTAAYQAPPSMGFSRQEYWSGVSHPKHQESGTDLGLASICFMGRTGLTFPLCSQSSVAVVSSHFLLCLCQSVFLQGIASLTEVSEHPHATQKPCKVENCELFLPLDE